MEEASVAGESPDRSKQNESSAEPTSGSANSVPEARNEPAPDTARDPRLAVAREASSTAPSPARGGVDTATRIFSRRELSEAVKNAEGSAEAAGADGAAGAADAAGTGGDAGTGDAEGAGGSGETERPEQTHDTGDSEAEQPRGTRGSEAGKAQRAKDAPDADDPEAGAPKDAPSADNSESGAAKAAGGSASGDAKGAGDGAGAASGASGERDAADVPGDDRLRAAVAAWVASADDDEEQAAAEAGSGTQEDAESGSEAEKPTAAEKRAQKPAAAGRRAEDTGQPVAGAEGEQEAAVASGGDEADEDAEARTDADATEDAAGPVAGESDSQDDQPTADGEDAPQGPPAPGDESRTGGVGGSTTAEGAAKAVDQPTADGEDAPQGPPAPGDESRTGGAGGSTAAEGAAKAVDQPTAVFKAVRPAKPPVDQPTTTLKAPKPKPEPEPAPERTSKFVALKTDVTSPVPQVGPERTTQQPLPPKPPLDLLAELTNTPPPPDTPVRTAVRRIKIWTPLVLLLAIVFAVVQAVRPLPSPTLDLTAEETYTFEGGKVDIPWPADGQAALDVDGLGTFGSSGTQKPVPIASVAKVMTAYLILRDHPLKSGTDGPKIKIDQAAEDQGANAGQESTVKVTAGDTITQREALQDILIASANNIARLLARWDAGSEKAFVEKMNAAADDLGMKNTTYTDPSGLNNTTVSTAVDQVKLAKAAMKEPAFREVAALTLYYDYKGAKHYNWNQLVGKNDVVGIKTGTTTSALGNLVFAAKKEIDGESRTIIGAVVRQPPGGSDNTILQGALSAGDQLIRAAQDALKSATLLKKGDVVGYVDDGLGGRTPVVATKDVPAIGWAGLKVKLTFAYDDVPHTAKAGTKVGTLTVGDGTSGAVKIPVALGKELTEPGFTDKLTRLG
jgi:serine-type D-Ala-D-Ala carboxypeptidase (penicillin-binding protein 5/6)